MTTFFSPTESNQRVTPKVFCHRTFGSKSLLAAGVAIVLGYFGNVSSLLLAAHLPPQPDAARGAIQITTATQRAEIPATGGASFGTLQALTIEAWVNITFPSKKSDWTPMITKGSDWGLSVRLFSENPITQQIGFLTGTSSADELIYSGPLGGGWKHVAAVLDGATKRLYVNGALVAQTPYTTPVRNDSPTAPVVIGDLQKGLFRGGVDALRIWSRARSQTEIRADIDRDLLPGLPGLLGEWRFDEKQGTTSADSSGNGRTAALFGASPWIDGLGLRAAPPLAALPRQALRFSAAGQDAEVLPSEELNLTTATAARPFTLESWVNLDSFPDWQTVVSKGNAWAMLIQRVGSGAAGKLVFRTRSAGQTHDLTGGTELLPGRWYHLAVVYDGAKKWLYVDGHPDGEGLGIGPEITPFPVRLGGNAEAASFWLRGQMDTVRIWKTARTEALILASQFNIFQGGQPNLVAEWRFDEGAGAVAFDISLGDARRYPALQAGWTDANRVAGLVFQSVSPQTTALAPTGAIAFTFNGASGSPDLALDPSESDTDAFQDLTGLTVETWLKPDAFVAGQNQALITKGNGWALALEPSPGASPATAHLVFYSFADGSLHAVKSLGTVASGRWHHVAAVFDAAAREKRLYIDGLRDAGESAPLTFSGTLGEDAARIKIGSFDGSEAPLGSVLKPFAGSLDEARVWRLARSIDEIQNAMDHQLRGTEAGLFASWRFDKGQPAGVDSSLALRNLGGGVQTTQQVDGLPFLSPAPGDLAVAFRNPSGANGASIQHMQVPVAEEATFDFSQQFTLEAWLYVDALPADRAALISKGSWALSLNAAGKIIFTTAGLKDAADSPVDDLFSAQAVSAGEWHHIAAVLANSIDPNTPGKTRFIAIDGALDKSESLPAGAVTLNNQPVFVGAAPSGSTSPFQPVTPFNGYLDEVRVWNQPKSLEQIRARSSSQLRGDEPGLVEFWSFDEGSGLVAGAGVKSPARDGILSSSMSSLNRVHGVVLEQAPPAQYALNFSSPGQAVTIAPQSALQLGPSATFEAWIRPEARPSGNIQWRTVLSKGAEGYGLALDQNNFLRFFTDALPQNALSSAVPVSNGAWSHIAVVVNGPASSTTFYINGRRDARYNTATIANNSNPLFLGSRGGTSEFVGSLDEIRIWSLARPDLEIELLAFSPIPLNTPGLIGYWTANAGAGASLPDLSGAGLSGTLTGNPPPTWTDGNLWPPSPALSGLNLTANNAAVGLWVGQVHLNKANEAQRAIKGVSETLTPTADTAAFRILLHVDSSGTVRLLKDAVVMKPRSASSSAAPPDETQFVVVTDPSRIPQFEGIALRSGKLTGIRYGSAAYDFNGFEIPLLGGVGLGRACIGKILLPPDHPTNPFRHKFHPDHRTGFEITRQMTVQFDTAPTDPLAASPGFGVDELSGSYRETVTGLHKIPIQVEGRISLVRVGKMSRLNN